MSGAEVPDDSSLTENPLSGGPSVDVVEVEFGRGLRILDLASLFEARISWQCASVETKSFIAKLVGRESTFALKR